MKRILFLVVVLVVLCSVVFAKEQENRIENNWEISMMPKENIGDVEKNKWSLILENNLGIYAYDNTSVHFFRDKAGKKNLQQVEVDVKTVFINKDILKRVDEKYAKKLKKGDSTSYCLLHMIFNTADKTYKTTSMQVFSKKGKMLENKVLSAKFLPIPEKSFAEAMLEVLNRYMTDNKYDMLINNRK